MKDPKFSIFSTVRRCREQRLSMVQMPDQYKFIYQYISYWLQKNISSEWAMILNDYNKLVNVNDFNFSQNLFPGFFPFVGLLI